MPHVGLICPPEFVKLFVQSLRQQHFDIEALYTAETEATLQAAADYDIHFAATASDDVLLRKEVDIVVIVNMPHLHAQICVKSLGIGKSVVCGNPIGLEKDETMRMLNAAYYYPQLISMAVDFGWRHTDIFEALRQQLLDKVIGTVYVLNWQIYCDSLVGDSYNWLCEWITGGGALNIIGAVVIDLLWFLLRRKAVRVHCNLRNLQKDVRFNAIYRVDADDFCQFTLELENDLSAFVTINCHRSQRGFRQTLNVLGSEGKLAIEDNSLTVHNNSTSAGQLLFEDTQWKAAQGKLSDLQFLGFSKLVAKLKQSLDERSKPCESSWKKGSLKDAPGFADAHYAKMIISALRTSYDEQKWIEISNT